MSLISERNNLKIDDDAEARPERWLLSYSDLVTTLMVLFLTLYALQLAKYRELEVKILESRQNVKEVKNGADAPVSRNAAIVKQETAKTELLSLLKVLRDKGQININEESGGVEIGINAKILFHSGDAHLLPDSSDVLEQVAAALKNYSAHNILVEGHTDSVPISTAKYESNWELSSARAGAVVRFFTEKGIEPHRLAAIGRSDNIPLIVGDDAVARAANRRVTILVQY
jgi:chemotaxis protein MotB